MSSLKKGWFNIVGLNMEYHKNDLCRLNLESLPWNDLEKEAETLLKELFPICRSITGDGVRKTLAVICERTNFSISEIPSGTRCYDWTVPDEWNIRDAWIKDSSGHKIVDFKKSNIHLVSYSIPVDKRMTFEELDGHLYTLPGLPDAVPYRTTYYKKNWGFCLSQRQYESLDRSAEYHVKIDATLAPGNLTYAEKIVPGTSGREFLLSSYCCHPSLANDNLSGVVLITLVASLLDTMRTRHSYRIVIAPETIGAVAYLSRNEDAAARIEGGFIPITVAGPGKFGYKQTFLGNHLIDRVVWRTFKENGLDYIHYPFDIKGSDERQYSSPFFRIPVGTICKDKYYEYDYYHTSLDNLTFISSRWLVESLRLYLATLQKLEMDVTYQSLAPQCEPMLGKRNLYPETGGAINQRGTGSEPGEDKKKQTLDVILWIIFYADGQTPLLDIAEKSDIPMNILFNAAETLKEHGIIREIPAGL